MQLVVVARRKSPSGHTSITYRLRAVTLYAQTLTDMQSHEVQSPEAFPHLDLAPPARVASNLRYGRALLRHWSRDPIGTS